MIKPQNGNLELSLLNQLYSPFIKGLQQPLTVPSFNNTSEQESFQPEYHQIKKLGLKVNKNKIFTGSWNSRENFIYLKFMLQNSQDFQTEKHRRKYKVFYRLSKILKKRTPDQCRSHHQKLQLKYKDDLVAIMKEVHLKIQKSVAEEYVNSQNRIQQEQIQKMIEATTKKTKLQEFQIVSKCPWHEIKRKGPVIRIQINAISIQSW